MGIGSTPSGVGFGRNKRAVNFSIANGATGSTSGVADLGRPYAFLVIRCEDATNIAGATTLSAMVGTDKTDALVPLWNVNAEDAWVSGTLPTSGGFQFMLTAAFGVQRLRLVLSNAASGAVVLQVRGYDGVIP